MDPIYFDIETQSAADLRKVGGLKYAADPTTRILCVVFWIDDRYVVWIPVLSSPTFDVESCRPAGVLDPIEIVCGPDLPTEVDLRRPFVGHNVDAFDAHVWRHCIGGVIPEWIDTIHAARAGGFPAGLDRLGSEVMDRGKEKDGKLLIDRLCRAKMDSRGGVVYPPLLPGYLAKFLRYAIVDVLLLREVYRRTKGHGEPDVIREHRRINARGVGFDQELAAAIIDAAEDAAKDAKEDVERITAGRLRGDDLRSTPKMVAWLASHGVVLPSLNRAVVDQLLDDPFTVPDGVEVEGTLGDISRRAKDDGLSPVLVHQAAAEIVRQSAADAAEHNEIYDYAVRSLAEFGVRPTTLRRIADRGGDVTECRGLDLVADEMERRWPALFEEGRHNTDVVFDLVIEGRRKPITLTDAYRDAAAIAEEHDAGDWTIPDVVYRVLRCRRTVTRITAAKLERASACADDDGRIRDLHVYYSATTGRWSSARVQIHNLPRGVEIDVEKLTAAPSKTAFRDEAESRDIPLDDVLSTLVRPCLVPRPGRQFAIADFAGIEARGVAWIAGDRPALDVFRRGGDPYCVIASRIFGREISKKDKVERQIGKVVELGCGYGMGALKLGAYAAANRVDLAAAGVTAAQCIDAYRDAHPAIAGRRYGVWKGRVTRRGGVWHDLDAAVRGAVVAGASSSVARCVVSRVGDDVHIALPSGRPIVYRCARVESRIPTWGGDPIDAVVYTSPRGERTLYGGLLTENVVQAICRDLLAAALVSLRNLDVVLHVHDEIVVETDRPRDDLETLCRVMSTPPVWAEGFPIKVEGFAAGRYVKTPFKGSIKCESVNGVTI